MSPELSLLLSGLVFGLSAGLMPGPLFALLLAQTLRYGAREGVKVALAPLLTDPPIVALAFFLVSAISRIGPLLGAIALLGGAYLFYLGLEGLCFKGSDTAERQVDPRSVQKGVIANFLNPSPYLFWCTVGAPCVLKSLGRSYLPAVLFFAGFYLMLVGAKVLLALGVGRTRGLLKNRFYILAVRLLGLILFYFAFRFFRDGLRVFDLF
ncbi:MAG: LysE family translocator [Planctomycetes bacterium]|nr:LysE family translocator [Planctomycetota bacterium]